MEDPSNLKNINLSYIPPKKDKTGLGVISAKNISRLTTSSLENFFLWYGSFLAKYPLRSVCICLLIPALCSIGLLSFKEESNPYKLWIPQDSDYIKDHEWLWENYPPEIRFNSIILTAENVLTPKIFNKLYELHNRVVQAQSEDGKSWEDVCYKVPYIDIDTLSFLLEDYDFNEEAGQEEDSIGKEENSSLNNTKSLNPKATNFIRIKRENSLGLGFDPSIELDTQDYCSLLEDLSENKCLENSLLELISTDNYGEESKDILSKLTEQDIINVINTETNSKVFGRHQDFTKYLGQIERNSSGHIIGAKATFLRFLDKVNTSALSDESIVVKGSPVDKFTLNWEQSVIEIMQEEVEKERYGKMFFNVAKSFNDLSNAAIVGDSWLFGFGTGMLFIYVQIMLGKFNFVEQRPGLSSAGIGCCALALLTSFGLCSGLNLVFSPMHNIIPFLLLGIGIDDMFVIVQCYDNLKKEGITDGLTHEEVIGLTMKNAGVAITVTSTTNFLVFAIGATSVLPALQSFCLYSAVGIGAVFIYQATIFTALFSLDTKRINSRRNGCMPLYVHSNWEPNQFSQKNIAPFVFEKFGKLLVHPLSKAVVILMTSGIVAVGVWGLSSLRQEFNPIWFIPKETYLRGWFDSNQLYFPKEGERVEIKISNIDYIQELPKLTKLVQKLTNETDILTSVDSWSTELSKYIEGNQLFEDKQWIENAQENNMKFYQILTNFLFSPSGAKYKGSFHYANDLICGEANSDIMLTSIELTHKLFSGPAEWIPAMNKVKQLVRDANFSSRAFPVGTEYASWETDEIISGELSRNMGFSLLCVFITTLLLLADLQSCIIVLACVVLTLINVGGFMHLWGLTIDVISCTNLVIAVGLCVDYIAHITHCFIKQKGDRNERMVKTLRDIGPAVLNGGCSTFLAFILMAGSTSHVFISFFKIFFLVVVFGLFHALVFLPVLLSLIGPKECEEDSSEAENADDVDDAGKIKNEFSINNSWSELNLAQVNAGFESEESSECSQSENSDSNSSSLDSPRTSEKNINHPDQDISSESSDSSKL